MSTWFTSDPHYWHNNVIRYCQRPFADIEEMNEVLIQNWNSVVKPNDLCFVLGDFAFAGAEKIKAITARLNGVKGLIMGNHDWKFKAARWSSDLGFTDALARGELYNQVPSPVLLSHFPYRGAGDHGGQEERYAEHRLEDKGDWLFHGHVHNAWKRKGRMINVGCDVRAYTPVSLDELIEEMRAANDVD